MLKEYLKIIDFFENIYYNSLYHKDIKKILIEDIENEIRINDNNEIQIKRIYIYFKFR